MNTPRPTPTLPATHALAHQLERWTRLRDELTQLNAKLEYLQLMLRLHAKR